MRLKKSTLPEDARPFLCSKKDISLYTDTAYDTGLVQPQDKIVVRYALTIYPYSLGIFIFILSIFSDRCPYFPFSKDKWAVSIK